MRGRLWSLCAAGACVCVGGGGLWKKEDGRSPPLNLLGRAIGVRGAERRVRGSAGCSLVAVINGRTLLNVPLAPSAAVVRCWQTTRRTSPSRGHLPTSSPTWAPPAVLGTSNVTAPCSPTPSTLGIMVRMPSCVGLAQPWIEPANWYVINDLTEAHTHDPTSAVYPVWLNPVLMRRQLSLLLILGPKNHVLQVVAAHKAVGSDVRIDVEVIRNEDAQRSNFLVFSPLHPGVPLSEDAMHIEYNIVVQHPTGLVVYDMLVNYGQQPADRLFNRLTRGAPRMSASPSNGPVIGAADYDEAMSVGPGYSSVPGSSHPYIGAGRLVFWPRHSWDQTFVSLVAAVCSSAAISGYGPIDLVDDAPGEVGPGVRPGARSGTRSGTRSGLGVSSGADAGSSCGSGAGAGAGEDG